MKFTRMHIFSILGGIAIIGIIGFFGFATSESDNRSNSETRVVLKENPAIEIHNAEEDLTEEEKRAIKFVQEHKGSDNQGDNIATLIGQIITSKYPDDVIFDSETKLGWSAYTDPENPQLQGVVFDFKSSVDEFSFLWYVDLQSKVIYAVGGGAEELLNIVDSEK